MNLFTKIEKGKPKSPWQWWKCERCLKTFTLRKGIKPTKCSNCENDISNYSKKQQYKPLEVKIENGIKNQNNIIKVSSRKKIEARIEMISREIAENLLEADKINKIICALKNKIVGLEIALECIDE